jgi:hypothetical protein
MTTPPKGRPPSPYLVPGFYDRALAEGRHRDIVGGRWEETGRIVIPVLQAEGLVPTDRVLDIGAGPLRLGRHIAGMVGAGDYWATDASHALMQRGWEVELDSATRARLPAANLIGDADFTFDGVPQDITFALAFAVFTHLPRAALDRALPRLRARFPQLRRLLFTVFLAPEDARGPFRQADGVVTHPDRAPWHMAEGDVRAIAGAAGFATERRDWRLPRGQVLFVARPC